MTLDRSSGDLLAQSRQVTNLHDDELRRRAVQATANKDAPELVALSVAYLAYGGGAGVASPDTAKAACSGTYGRSCRRRHGSSIRAGPPAPLPLLCPPPR